MKHKLLFKRLNRWKKEQIKKKENKIINVKLSDKYITLSCNSQLGYVLLWKIFIGYKKKHDSQNDLVRCGRLPKLKSLVTSEWSKKNIEHALGLLISVRSTVGDMKVKEKVITWNQLKPKHEPQKQKKKFRDMFTGSHFVFIRNLMLGCELETFKDLRKKKRGYKLVLPRCDILLQLNGLLISTWKLLAAKMEKKAKLGYNKYMVWGLIILLLIIVWKVRVKWKNRSVKHKGQNKHKANIQGGVIGMMIEKRKFMSKIYVKSRKSQNLYTLVSQCVEHQKLDSVFLIITIILAWKINLVCVPKTVTVFTITKTLEQDVGNNIFSKWQVVADKLYKELFIRVIFSIAANNRSKTAMTSHNALFLGDKKKMADD